MVAKALLQMLESGQAERFLGFPEKLAVRINGLAPTLLDGAFKRHRDALQPPASQPLPDQQETAASRTTIPS